MCEVYVCALSRVFGWRARLDCDRLLGGKLRLIRLFDHKLAMALIILQNDNVEVKIDAK